MSKQGDWFKSNVIGRLAAYFMQGLLLIAPAFVTVYAIFYIFNVFDSHVNDVFEYIFKFRFPGLGLVVMVAFITFVGFVGSLVIVRPLLNLFDLLLEKTPLVKDIYSSLKDFFGAFISNKKKFNKPVMFEMGKGSGVYKLGFITQDDLSELNILDKVAVYTPLSYNLSGIMYIVNRDQVEVLNDVAAGDMMKFIVSGGVTEIDDEEEVPAKPVSANLQQGENI
ncbi:MAG: DUF502 domain-containing protein [Bacteroidetes bacterium]|jgi:uncharacterized membrane protein|nr:DUF502 domain-containing protein [Bacteroidota bacterium]